MRMRSGFLCGCLLLGACSSNSLLPPEPRDGPPLTPSAVRHLPDPVVVSEPKSARGNPANYTVRGTTYHVLDSAAGYYATGLASWYGRKFHGRETSSGEPFDMYKLTAAHRTLPIPAFVRVTNLQNGKTTVVRVNDRGPFHADRLIDLSYAAAVKLGFADDGTARVRVEVLAPAKDYFLQAGAFSDLATADLLKADLEALTGQPTYVVRVSSDTLYRVRIGPVKGHPEAVRLQALISAAKHGQPMILPH